MSRLSPQLKFTFAVLVSLVVGWRALWDTLGLAVRRDEYTHILLIIPISAALIFLQWQPMKRAAPRTSYLGFVLLIAAVLMGLGARFAPSVDAQLFLGMLALVTWWIGAFASCFGAPAFRSALFPLCFLFWLVPIPEFALNKAVAFWQQSSAIVASWLFSIAGVPVTQDGIMLSIPGLNIEVATECSSLRSSLILIVTSMVLGNLFLRSNWRRAAFVLAAIPLSIAKNGLRIFVLCMLGTRVDPGFLHGNLHHHGGIVFFLLSLFVLLLWLWLLRRSETGSSPDVALNPIAP